MKLGGESFSEKIIFNDYIKRLIVSENLNELECQLIKKFDNP